MDFAFFEYYLSAVLLVTAMVGMGATLTPVEFARVIKQPQGVATVLVAQVLATPLFALSLAYLLGLPPGVSFGLLLVAALPGGLFSNLLTFLGRGNVALSITATGLSTLLCLVSTALILRVVGGAQLSADFAMPVGRILVEIAGFLLAPLLLGMLIRGFWPQRAGTVSRIFLWISMACLVIFVIGAIASGRLQLARYGWVTPIALVLFAIGSLWIGVGIGALFRLAPDDRFTASIEVVVRNGNLGLLLKASIFPAVAGVHDPIGDGVLYVILFYAGFCLVVAMYEVWMKRMKWGLLYAERPSKMDAVSR